MKLKSKNEKNTMAIAMNFAKQLKGGEVILMYGDLGAGKTVFAKGLAKALGVKEIVKSPTFNIMKIYKLSPSSILPPGKGEEGGGLFCHIDAYRLKNFDDLLDIGADEYLGKENVISAVEWAERIIKIEKYKNIKTKIITVKMKHGEKDDERIITIN